MNIDRYDSKTRTYIDRKLTLVPEKIASRIMDDWRDTVSFDGICQNEASDLQPIWAEFILPIVCGVDNRFTYCSGSSEHDWLDEIFGVGISDYDSEFWWSMLHVVSDIMRYCLIDYRCEAAYENARQMTEILFKKAQSSESPDYQSDSDPNDLPF